MLPVVPPFGTRGPVGDTRHAGTESVHMLVGCDDPGRHLRLDFGRHIAVPPYGPRPLRAAHPPERIPCDQGRRPHRRRALTRHDRGTRTGLRGPHLRRSQPRRAPPGARRRGRGAHPVGDEDGRGGDRSGPASQGHRARRCRARQRGRAGGHPGRCHGRQRADVKHHLGRGAGHRPAARDGPQHRPGQPGRSRAAPGSGASTPASSCSTRPSASSGSAASARWSPSGSRVSA